jgi:hypothetical protein
MSAIILTLLVVVTSAHAGGAAPQISALSETTLPRSGRLLIFGSGFGTQPGTVTIGGLDAIVTKWFDDEIHAYVPEATPLGQANVQVTTAGGPSNAVGRPASRTDACDGVFRWTTTCRR